MKHSSLFAAGAKIAIAAFIGLTSFASAEPADSFDLLMSQGRQSFLKADIPSAAASYEKACPPDMINGLAPARRAECEHHLATIDNARGNAARAEVRYLRALSAWEEAGGPYLASLCTTLMNLGELYRTANRPRDAEKMLLRSIDVARNFEKEHPEQYPQALSRLGGLYGGLDQPERGRPLLLKAIELFGSLALRQDAELGYSYNSLGIIDLAAGHHKAGEANLREAVRLAASSLGEEHPETIAYQTNLALAFVLEGQFDRADPLLRRARFLVEARSGPSAPGLVTIFGELSASASGQNKLAIAEEYAMHELSVLQLQPSPDRTAIALAQVALGKLYLRERKMDEAEKILPDAVAAERGLITNGRVLADGICRLAELRAMRQSWRESEALYREALSLYEQRLGANSPEIAPVLRAYAEVLKRAGGSKSDIKGIEGRARAITGFAPGV